jgi:Pvc16 N-terminal domain
MSAASIPGTSESVAGLLRSQLEARLGPSRDGYEVQLFRSADFSARPTGVVSLFLYRVDVDEARRFGDTPAVSPTRPGGRWLGLELSYLLTVWGRSSAAGEQRMLQHCMEILQEMAIVQGSWLHPSHSWEPDDALRISLAPMNQEDMIRLWDGFDLPYQLSIPYLVRTVRIAARPREDVPVLSRTLAFGSEQHR